MYIFRVVLFMCLIQLGFCSVDSNLFPCQTLYKDDGSQSCEGKLPFPCTVHWLQERGDPGQFISPGNFNVLWACSEPSLLLKSDEYYRSKSAEFDLIITNKRHLVRDNIIFSPGYVSLHTLVAQEVSKEFSVSYFRVRS